MGVSRQRRRGQARSGAPFGGKSISANTILRGVPRFLRPSMRDASPLTGVRPVPRVTGEGIPGFELHRSTTLPTVESYPTAVPLCVSVIVNE